MKEFNFYVIDESAGKAIAGFDRAYHAIQFIRTYIELYEVLTAAEYTTWKENNK